MVEEELNYVTVAFKKSGLSRHEKPIDLEIIYDEITTEDLARDTNPVISEEKEKKAPLCTLLHLVAAGLGIGCVILVCVIITVCIYFNAVMSENRSENTNLTAQTLQLSAEKRDLERQTEELTRQKDGFNWTMGVIMQYKTFPVDTRCPQRVCKPCLDGWVSFQSNCYLFSTSEYSSYWKSWEESRDHCRWEKADLVVIESLEEQEFINNNTNYYRDEKHGYWMGLCDKDEMNTWLWEDGSNFTVTYWRTQQGSSGAYCALTLPRADPLANWQKTGCDMKNRWICETRALVKSDITKNQMHYQNKLIDN